MHNRIHGRLGVLTEDNTIGEESILDKKYSLRLETVYAESD
jgi:hypothetical protein